MNRRLLWKLFLIIATGTVALFYVINILTSRAEEGMSFIAPEYREQIKTWGREAEQLYLAGDEQALTLWLEALQAQEQTWAAVVKSDLTGLAGSQLTPRFFEEFSIGRSVDWMIHLYFEENPIMEVTFADRRIHFLILLPQRMRPGLYWGCTQLVLQIILPMILLSLLSLVLYRHIMNPLRELERATRAFSRGNLDVRVRQLLRRLPETAEIHNSSHRALGQALENIIRNALRYTHAGGQVCVELNCLENSYVIQVWDQGPGVPEDCLEHIFEPFFRVDQARSTASPTSGFGLGLALARRQLRAVGGSVSALNLAHGGLQMTVILPR